MTGPLILVLGLSGAVLVFRSEIEEAANGTPAISSPATSRESLDRVVAAALARYPAAEPRSLRLPAESDQPYRVELLSGRQRLEVAVDPYTLRVIRGRAAERSVLVAVRSLHAALHGGRAGALIVGLLGVWLIVESLTGLWLCWPLVKRRPPASGLFQREGSRSRTLHRLVGGLSLALGLLVALTGAALALTSAFADPRDAAPTPPGKSLARLDMVVERADVAVPGGRISALIAEAGHTVRVEKRLPWGPAGERVASVMIDRDAGSIVAVRVNPRPGGWDLVRRLHYGDFAGWASRVVWALVGLALPVLSITGYLISGRRGAAGRS